MTDIVKRLRAQEMWFPDLYSEAADEIERLRAALRECEAELDDYYRNEYSGTHPYNEKKLKQAMAANPARAALEGE